MNFRKDCLGTKAHDDVRDFVARASQRSYLLLLGRASETAASVGWLFGRASETAASVCRFHLNNDK